MSLAGNLANAPLLEILMTIAEEQRDGCLTLTRGHLRAEVYFRRGQWLAAERVPVGPPLTEQFVELGYMTPDEIEEVILVPFDEAAVLPDGQIVQALMADGLLAREQLHHWAMNDALTLINAINGWPDGDFSFMDGIHPPQELVLVPLAVENILASTSPSRPRMPGVSLGQGMAGMPGTTGRHSGQGAATLPLRPETVLTFADIQDSGQVVEISREEWLVLAHVNGVNPLGTIADTLRMEAHILVEIARNLLDRGLLEAGAAPTSPYA